MTYAHLFDFVNASVLPAWILLIFAPRWSWTRKLVHSMLWPMVLGGLYIAVFAAVIFLGHGAEGGSFTSIEGVRALFSSDAGIVIGWAHFLVFDLFVGAWCARDAARRGFKHALLIPCLIFCFMAGPVGLVMYLLLRKATGKGGWSLAED